MPAMIRAQLSVRGAPCPKAGREGVPSGLRSLGNPGVTETPAHDRVVLRQTVGWFTTACLSAWSRAFWEQAGSPVTSELGPTAQSGSKRTSRPCGTRSRPQIFRQVRQLAQCPQAPRAAPAEPSLGEQPLTRPRAVLLWLQSGRRPPGSCWCPRRKCRPVASGCSGSRAATGPPPSGTSPCRCASCPRDSGRPTPRPSAMRPQLARSTGTEHARRTPHLHRNWGSGT